MLLTAISLTWVASCGVAAAFLTAVLLFTRAMLARRRTHVNPAAVVLAASIVGGSMSLLALVLLAS
jgi:uncharacterized membrane protein